MLDVLEYPAEALRQQCSTIDLSDASWLRELADDMVATMLARRGVGLAAPQVGHTVCLVVIDPSQGKEANQLALMINPCITWRSLEATLAAEGCLSLPGVTVQVPRADAVEVEYMDLGGHVVRDSCTGFRARVVQHEVDHLAGRLSIDTLSRGPRRAALKQLEKGKR